MEEQETPKDKALSKEDWLIQYLEKEIDFYNRLSPEGCIAAGTWLVAKSGKRQERLTKWVVVLTIAVLVCAAATVGLAIVSLVKG
jgi:hypothetical protein